MPVSMLDYCHAPTPYLIGVHSSLYQRLIEDVGQSMIDEGIASYQALPNDMKDAYERCIRYICS